MGFYVGITRSKARGCVICKAHMMKRGPASEFFIDISNNELKVFFPNKDRGIFVYTFV